MKQQIWNSLNIYWKAILYGSFQQRNESNFIFDVYVEDLDEIINKINLENLQESTVLEILNHDKLALSLKGNTTDDINKNGEFIWRSTIKSLEPIKKLPLKTLYISIDHDDMDLTPMAECKALEECWIIKNGGLDLGFLKKKMFRLKSLALCAKNIENAEILIRSVPSLEHLFLETKLPPNLSFVKHLNLLKKLELERAGQGSIQNFAFDGSPFYDSDFSSPEMELDLNDIAPLKGLEQLVVSRFKIKNLKSFHSLTGLVELSLSHTSVSDTRYFSKLVNLKRISLFNNAVEDLSFLKELVKLEEIDFSKNKIESKQLKHLTSSRENLKSFLLSENHFTDISALSTLVNLVELDISSNFIQDTAPLSALKNLKTLNLLNNPTLKNISPISELNLEQIKISNHSELILNELGSNKTKIQKSVF